MTDRERAERMWAAITELARGEGSPVMVRHVCQACAAAVRASGVALYVTGDLGVGEPVYATDTTTEQVTELEITLGEGPALEALNEERPVLVSELAAEVIQRRWPMFGPAAVAARARAVFAFPVGVGAIELGVLEVYRDVAGPLRPDELGDVLVCAEVAMQLIFDAEQNHPAEEDSPLLDAAMAQRWTAVHYATGMVSVQLRTDLTSAYLRLRAQAFLTDRRLSEVAAEVVDGTLRFHPEVDGPPWQGRPDR